MRLLNIGCGNTRPQGAEWVNLDDLWSQLPKGSYERGQLDAERNYVNFVIGTEPLPFQEASFDGCLLCHVLEHFDAQQGLALLKDCYRILKPGGCVLVSVPDASYFRRVYHEDRNENWPRLFEVTDPANPIPTFFEAALWFDQHKAILTEDAVWAYLMRSGFTPFTREILQLPPWECVCWMSLQLNRRIFSLEMIGLKPNLI